MYLERGTESKISLRLGTRSKQNEFQTEISRVAYFDFDKLPAARLIVVIINIFYE